MLGQVETSGRVLGVIHNRGGRIFDRLPRLRGMQAAAAAAMTNPHDADLAGLALLWGMKHHVVRTVDDFDGFEAGDVSVLLEIRPSASETEAVLRMLARP